MSTFCSAVRLIAAAMKLRNHPLLSYHGLPSWPPLWAWIGVKEDRNPKGEVGVLRAVAPDTESPRFFLTIEYEDDAYMGCVFVQNELFCRQLAALLQGHLGRPIEQIAALDVGHTA
jgi:hypothetical protein